MLRAEKKIKIMMKPSKKIYTVIKIKIFNELFAFIESLYLDTAEWY